jgi:hypothetical protein
MKKITLIIVTVFISFFAIAQKSNIRVWKTITLGADKKSELITKFKSAKALPSSGIWQKFTDSIKIEPKQTVKLALLSITELGSYKETHTGDYVDYKKICTLAKKKGLKLCPREVILQFPLQCKSTQLPKNTSDWIVISTKPIFNGESKYPYEQLYQYYYGNIGGQLEIRISEIITTDGIGYGGDQSDLFEQSKFLFIIP